jgi:FkbM family methyltransferase
MGEKLKKFARYVYVYNFYGVYLFIKIYWLKARTVNLKNYGKFYLRKGSMDDEIFTQMFIYKQYNIGIQDPKVIVDLGGNNGMSAVYFHKKYPDAKIYVLEPDKENYKALQRHIDGIENIVPLNKAIWKENGTVSLDSGESWAIRIDMISGKNLAEAITMDILLSTYGIEQVDILKIDIESAEKELFEASTTFLKKTKNLIIELHDWMRPGCAAPFFRSLADYNYIYTVNHENTIILDLQPHNKQQ